MSIRTHVKESLRELRRELMDKLMGGEAVPSYSAVIEFLMEFYRRGEGDA